MFPRKDTKVRVQAATTQIIDSYRAGVALGEQLLALRPEVVFLFSSIHMARSAGLLQGMHDVLEYEPLLVGASGDGVFFTEGAWQAGVSALGLNSEGAVRWHLVCVPDVIARPAAAMEEALAQANAWLDGRTAPLMFLFADLRVDASELERVMAADTRVPIVGGLAGDDNLMNVCALFANREVLNDCLLLLVAEGDLHFSLTLGHHLSSIGQIGRVDEAQGRRLLRIDGKSAQAFVADQFGRELGASDVTTLALLDGESDHARRLRSVLPHVDAAGGLELYAGVRAGERVQVCVARPDELLAEVNDIASRLKPEQAPLAALLFSCAGRKATLGAAFAEEARLLERACPNLPLAGFPSFGEIAPVPLDEGGFSRTLFHNMTYVLLLIEP